jgi:hypothetical protein
MENIEFVDAKQAKIMYRFINIKRKLLITNANIWFNHQAPMLCLKGRRRKDSSSNLCVQTGSGADLASCIMGTGGPFPGAKTRPRRDADHSPHLVPSSRMSRSYTSSPPSAFVACSGTAFAFSVLTCTIRPPVVRGSHGKAGTTNNKVFLNIV